MRDFPSAHRCSTAVTLCTVCGTQAVSVLKELNLHDTVVSRRPPNLLWVVQNFNHFNLQNSRLTVEQVTGRGCGMETEPTYSLPYGA